MKPEMIPVSSSNIEELGYEESNQDLYVRFLNGDLYVYRNVPENAYKGLLDAESKGKYHNKNIKGCYPYESIG